MFTFTFVSKFVLICIQIRLKRRNTMHDQNNLITIGLATSSYELIFTSEIAWTGCDVTLNILLWMEQFIAYSIPRVGALSQLFQIITIGFLFIMKLGWVNSTTVVTPSFKTNISQDFRFHQLYSNTKSSKYRAGMEGLLTRARPRPHWRTHTMHFATV